MRIQSDIKPITEYEWNTHLLRIHRDEFQTTFNKSLHKYMHPIYGFDIVAFDTYIAPPDGTSLQDYLISSYGKDASELVSKLISSWDKLPSVETWVNMDYDIAAEKPKGFHKCTYSFLAFDGSRLEGWGWYKNGLVVSGGHGNFIIYTKQGVMVRGAGSMLLAKTYAAQILPAIDFENAQTTNFTDEQTKAIKRVFNYWIDKI